MSVMCGWGCCVGFSYQLQCWRSIMDLVTAGGIRVGVHHHTNGYSLDSVKGPLHGLCFLNTPEETRCARHRAYLVGHYISRQGCIIPTSHTDAQDTVLPFSMLSASDYIVQ